MALEGSIQDMSLVDLLHVFRMGPKTGVLLLNKPPERAIVYVANGNPVDAAVLHATNAHILMEAETAILELFSWDEATFVFNADNKILSRPQRIFRDTEELIIEGIRQRSQKNECPLPNQLTLDSRLVMATLSAQSNQGVNLNLDQWRILSQISICSTLREVCANVSVSAEKVLRIASELIAIGLIEVHIDQSIHSMAMHTSPIRQPVGSFVPQAADTPSQRRLSAAAVGSTAHPGKSLMNAIMRRVRGL